MLRKIGSIMSLAQSFVHNKNAAGILNLSDEELMLYYQKGNQEAFNELLNRYHKPIYNFIYRTLRDRRHVDEVFQEVFLRVVKACEHYTPKAKFSTWVYTIARNYCIDVSRKSDFRSQFKHEFSAAQRQVDENPIEQSGDPQVHTEKDVSRMEIIEKLELALEKINPDQKEVFVLRERMGLSFEEIAEIVNSTVNTVKSRMRYSLKALRMELESMGVQGPSLN